MQLKASAAHHAALRSCRGAGCTQPGRALTPTKEAKTFSGDIDQHSGGGRPPAKWPEAPRVPVTSLAAACPGAGIEGEAAATGL